MSDSMILSPVVEWKEYKISELFYLYRGKRYKKQDHIKGDYNYVSSTETNNGVDGKVAKLDNLQSYKNVLGINNSGSVGKVFYHENKSIFSDHVTILKLKNYELNKYIALFMIPIIEKLKVKYLFAREMTNTRLENEYIMLPTKNRSPDWEYMEKYIKYLENENIPSLNELKKPKSEVKVQLNNIEDWKYFHLEKYFNMSAGKYYSSEEYGLGKTPLVSTSDVNNGILKYIDVEPKFKENSITIGKVGCACYYHNKPFVASPDVTVLEPKGNFLNKYIGMFITLVISQEKPKWTYGRQIRLNDCRELSVKLPCANNEPDWEYMEKYIKSLPFSSKI